MTEGMAEGLRYIVEAKPGTTVGKGLRIPLSAEQVERLTFGGLLEHITKEYEAPRDKRGLVRSIVEQMAAETYGITVNSDIAVTPDQKINNLFRMKTAAGRDGQEVKYNGLDIIVTGKQKGGCQ